MKIETKFDINQWVRRVGTQDVGVVTAIAIGVDRKGEIEIVYDVYHAAADNLHANADFGGDGFEFEFEAIKS